MATIRIISNGKRIPIYRIDFSLLGSRRCLTLGNHYSRRQVKTIGTVIDDIVEAIETNGKLRKSTLTFLNEMPKGLKKQFSQMEILS